MWKWGFTRVPCLTQKFPSLNKANAMIIACCNNFTFMYLEKSFLLWNNCFNTFADDWHFLCFRLTNKQLSVQLDVQVLGWAYTRVHSQFWNWLKNFGMGLYLKVGLYSLQYGIWLLVLIRPTISWSQTYYIFKTFQRSIRAFQNLE